MARYVVSAVGSRGLSADFDQVESYCMFLGYPRSGHSLAGSLMDAHPNMVIAHELHALRYVRYRFSRDQIFWLLLRNSQHHAGHGRQWTGYDYHVDGQWQGRYETLKVIGDKRGGTSARKLVEHPQLLPALMKRVRVPTRFVHVVRNPFDNITTIYHRAHERDERDGRPARSFVDAEEHYFRMVESVWSVCRALDPSQVLHIHLEDLIADPKKTLQTICDFYGVDAPADYLDACASIVFESPRKTRSQYDWSEEELARVAERMRPYPFLARYGFQD